MSRRKHANAASPAALGFPETSAAPARPRQAAELAGDAASPAALARLDAAVSEVRTLAIAPLLRQALAALKAEDHVTGGECAIKALELDEKNGMAWYLLAIAREKAGDFKSSVQAYEAALELLADQTAVAHDLGRLAHRMGMHAVAEQLFRHFLARHPDSHEVANNLACALRDQGRYLDAIGVIRPTINDNPGQPLLWNTLGTILAEQGDLENAVTFFEEALRLEPAFNKARYNRGNARVVLGDLDGALDDCMTAMASPMAEDERLMMQLARSTIRIAMGDVGAGWDDYEARVAPLFADVTHFMIDRPRWTPESDIAGKTLLLMGEQGLGDEVLFANMIPDILDALGPAGRLVMAVEKRLVPLFRRSFPTALVGAHATFKVDGRTVRGAPFIQDWGSIDLWAPLASPLRRFRRTVDAFPARERFLIPDPARVAHWRGVLEAAPKGPKVGLLWKSMNVEGARGRYFSPFDHWRPVLETPGVSFVNMQYGDCAAELARARSEFGVEIWSPPGIDLKDDLDDVAALSCALDLTVGFANATSNIAAACGAPTWMVSTPGAWPRLGTPRMPWYPQVRVFLPQAFAAWGPVMEEVAGALRAV